MPNLSTKKPLLGILGGLGPMASAYFYELLVSHTSAQKDSDHIDLLLSGRASTPDRTAFITGASDEDPAPIMCADAKCLEAAGATLLAIPCNTAHFFYRQIADSVRIPVINIVEETVRTLRDAGVGRIGVLATEGTVLSGAYRTVCEQYGIACEVPDRKNQERLNHLIYQVIKRGQAPDPDCFSAVADSLSDRNCDRLVLGCTELSLIERVRRLDDSRFADSMEILALQTILACGKHPVGFPEWMMLSVTERSVP